MAKRDKPQDHLAWFRNASPYINLHRGRTFVLAFGGETLEEAAFPSLVHDIALLNSLGVRLVLVYGTRPQTDQRLSARGVTPQYHKGLRVTDNHTLAIVKEAVGSVRVEIEALLSTGLPNTPMSGARLCITSGNFVVARPLGVHDGIDYCHTGAVRRIDAHAIHGQLEQENLVLLSSLGYSPTGEVFNLLAEDVATEAAIALHADKLIFLMEGEGILDGRRRVIPKLDPPGAEQIIEHRRKLDDESRIHLRSAIHACRRGVARTHLISRRKQGALLQELFTRDGAGTLITSETYEGLRPASSEDVASIVELITPLEEQGILVRRSREQLELEIDHFTLIEKDGTIIGCAALYPFPADRVAELGCIAIHPDYKHQTRGDDLLNQLEKRATGLGLEQLFVLTTRTAHWFRERGFVPASIDQLPVKRRRLYNYKRNSKVFIKTLAS